MVLIVIYNLIGVRVCVVLMMLDCVKYGLTAMNIYCSITAATTTTTTMVVKKFEDLGAATAGGGGG